MKQLYPLGRDVASQEVLTCGFVVDHSELNMVSTDYHRNLQLYQFAPHSILLYSKLLKF